MHSRTTGTKREVPNDERAEVWQFPREGDRNVGRDSVGKSVVLTLAVECTAGSQSVTELHRDCPPSRLPKFVAERIS